MYDASVRWAELRAHGGTHYEPSHSRTAEGAHGYAGAGSPCSEFGASAAAAIGVGGVVCPDVTTVKRAHCYTSRPSDAPLEFDIDQPGRPKLSVHPRMASIAASGRVVLVVDSPAGPGKTTRMGCFTDRCQIIRENQEWSNKHYATVRMAVTGNLWGHQHMLYSRDAV